MTQTQLTFTKTGSTQWKAAGVGAKFDAFTREPIVLQTVVDSDAGDYLYHTTQMDAVTARVLAAQLLDSANAFDAATGRSSKEVLAGLARVK